jgi:hypothetical protein
MHNFNETGFQIGVTSLIKVIIGVERRAVRGNLTLRLYIRCRTWSDNKVETQYTFWSFGAVRSCTITRAQIELTQLGDDK